MKRRHAHENVHHALPRSRWPEHAHAPWNLRWVDRDRHAFWHALVVNRSPCEGVLKLLKEFAPSGEHLNKDPALDELIHYLVEIKLGRE